VDGPGARVVDLGCGPGTLTSLLAARWPRVRVTGLDSSPEMIARARADASPVDYQVADLRDYVPDGATRLIVANASLHWVPDHPRLLVAWAAALPAGAQVAVQVPGMRDAPSHRAVRALAGEPSWADVAGAALDRTPQHVLDPAGYAAVLTAAGCAVDAWETTYLHPLAVAGTAHPVRTWLEGTTLRPLADVLDAAAWARFVAALDLRLAADYPVDGGMVWFPFRRVFVVARHAGDTVASPGGA
jgi:trans-aconitate 2-methyltransferase